MEIESERTFLKEAMRCVRPFSLELYFCNLSFRISSSLKLSSLFVFDAIAGAQTGDENGGKLRGSVCLMIPTVSRITLVILISQIISKRNELRNYRANQGTFRAN